ncbi:MAG: hypothetical protein JWP94_519 [Mucilaginibacter sp.]|nr:hypothetical protein [Mucilaginibacter sp.]
MPVHYFDPNGVDSLRDNGYRDTAMALAEIIDNSIQADATKIEILLLEKLSKTGKRESLVNEIVIADNGTGMDKSTLESSLRFGGGTRHGAKKGLGKFGMGLPNSSASQCPRFEVYSWQHVGAVHFNYFDFKEIKENQSEFLPEVQEAEIPKHISDILKPQFPHGTIVRWMNCDRLVMRRSNRLVPHIVWPIGRIFRHFIHGQKVEIKIRVFQDNGHSLSEVFPLETTVKPVDPLFLMTDTQLPNSFNDKATSDAWEEGEYLFPDPNGNKENKALFAKIGESVKLKFSIVKPEIRKSQGSSNTETGLGKIYREFQGLSIVRENREIKLSDFGFITDVSDPRNRWWKVEVNFEPTFDGYFGLDNTKQNVHAFRRIENKDLLERTEDDTQLEFICELSEFVESQIREMLKHIVKMGAGAIGGPGSPGGGAGPGDGTPNPGESGPFPAGVVVVPVPEAVPDGEEEVPETNKEREELAKWLLLRYPEYAGDETKLNLSVDWFFATDYNQVVVFLQLGAAEFYNYKPIGHRTIIEINTEHDFYLEFIKPLFDEGDLNKIDPILLLFGAMVEAEKDLVSYQQYISRFRSLFAVKLNQFILDWKEKK